MNSISIKLFLSLFGLTAIILFATIGLARWSFNYGFYDYLDSIEQDRLGRVSNQLVGHFQDNGGRWTENIDVLFNEILAADLYRPESAPSLATNNEILRAALSQSLEDQLRQLSNLDSLEATELVNSIPAMGMGPPGGMFGPPMGGLPPDALDIWKPNNPSLSDSSPLGGQNRPPNRPPRPEPLTVSHPTMLLDIDGVKLAGVDLQAEQGSYISQDIVVDGSKVGELRAAVSREFQTPLENAFSVQQKLASLSIIALSLLLAVIASWLLSRMMLAPIVTLKDGIGELANGEYRHQLVVDRQDELGMLMADVNKLGSNLQKNRSSRRGWLADISHELRTPVTVLTGEIEAIKDGLRELDMRSVDSLDHEVSRLKHLIDDLYQLSLSDIGGLHYEFARLDLAEFLNSIIQQYSARIKAAGLTVNSKIDSDIWINADEVRLEQLFSNLINNSIAYTDAPGQIQISLKQVENEVVVCIEDSAPGVDEKHLENIFDSLFREDKSRNRRKGGAGLGLTICRNIAQAHGAFMQASESNLGGVKIEVKFPLD